jgi:ankyrin repeat protein
MASISDQTLEHSFDHDALQEALHEGRSKIAIDLLNQLQDTNSAGGYLGNALQAAALGGNVAMIQLVLDHGADVNSLGRYGTALRAASFGGFDNAVRLLLQKGATIMPPDEYWRPDALEAAASRGMLSTVKLLWRFFARPSQKSLPTTTDMRCVTAWTDRCFTLNLLQTMATSQIMA